MRTMISRSLARNDRTQRCNRLQRHAEFSTANPPEKAHDAAVVVKFDYQKIRDEILAQWMSDEAKSPSGSQTKARYCCFTYHDAVQEYQKPTATWHWLQRELSSNVAGETGAVSIYKGALAALNLRPRKTSKEALEFCQTHMQNESLHLSYFQAVVPDGKHTRLLPLWRMAGWMVGFLPTMLGGSRALYVTVEAVETFVEEHFQEQIVPLQKEGKCTELVRLLEHCCEDEMHHKEDAARRLLNGDHNLSAWWVVPFLNWYDWVLASLQGLQGGSSYTLTSFSHPMVPRVFVLVRIMTRRKI